MATRPVSAARHGAGEVTEELAQREDEAQHRVQVLRRVLHPAGLGEGAAMSASTLLDCHHAMVPAMSFYQQIINFTLWEAPLSPNPDALQAAPIGRPAPNSRQDVVWAHQGWGFVRNCGWFGRGDRRSP